jgi:hypothetical protein
MRSIPATASATRINSAIPVPHHTPENWRPPNAPISAPAQAKAAKKKQQQPENRERRLVRLRFS